MSLSIARNIETCFSIIIENITLIYKKLKYLFKESKIMTTILRDKIYKKIKDSLSRRTKELMLELSKFFDLNTEALFQPTMMKRIIFSSSFEEKLFDIMGVTDDEVKNAIIETKLNDDKWFQRNRPVYFIILFAVKYYEEKGMKREKEKVLMLLSSIIYSGRHQKYFMYNDSNSFTAAMDYTVNNLSNKFLLKNKGTVFGALEDITLKSDKTYAKQLKNANDKEIIDWIMCLYTRINQFVKIFANEFYDNYNSKRFVNTQKDQDDETGDILDTENQSMAIQKITENVIIKIKSNKPDPKLCRICASSARISQIVFKNCMNSVYKNDDTNIQKLVALILIVFLVDGKNKVEDIHSAKFLLDSIQLISKSNVKEPNILNIKKTLAEIAEINSAEYNKTERQNTKIAITRAIFQYFILMIQISK